MQAYKFFILISIIYFLSPAFPVDAAPKAQLWDFWLPHDPGSVERVEHTFWDNFLKKYIIPGNDGINRIPYGKVSESDRNALKDYISRLSKVSVLLLSRAEQLPYWINLYNAITVNVILDHYPVESIRDIDISPGWFSDGPWGKKLAKIEGMEVTLDEIEHRILRPIWKDPRIHYAVNCASIGCPNLQSEAFTAENSNRLLDKGAREYVNHERGAELRENKVKVSSIYKWFISDFGGNDAGIIKHLQLFASPELKRQLESAKRISGHDYDWSLNDAIR
jgi:hypothetical protein